MRRLFTRSAKIVAVEDIAERFRLVTLAGPALREVTWAPGHKAQMSMEGAFTSRTYTPIDWDRTAGRTRILGYMHGEGPGSAWLRDARPGDECSVFGPHASLDASRLSGPLAIFGDETSIGLACALAWQDPTRAVTCCFEVRNFEACTQVLARLGLKGATLVARRQDSEHFDEMDAMLRASVSVGASFVLTGNAVTIQLLRRGLKQKDVPAGRISTKAYWAVGKKGLD
jgi:NADPH-dependent ferric siderophore reductase